MNKVTRLNNFPNPVPRGYKAPESPLKTTAQDRKKYFEGIYEAELKKQGENRNLISRIVTYIKLKADFMTMGKDLIDLSILKQKTETLSIIRAFEKALIK